MQTFLYIQVLTKSKIVELKFYILVKITNTCNIKTRIIEYDKAPTYNRYYDN